MEGGNHDDVVLDYLIKALRALGESGDPDGANRLAAPVWLALRDGDPRAAERINGAMHYLARLPQRPDSIPAAALTTQEDE